MASQITATGGTYSAQVLIVPGAYCARCLLCQVLIVPGAYCARCLLCQVLIVPGAYCDS